jgi:serine/threonine-protein kinase
LPEPYHKAEEVLLLEAWSPDSRHLLHSNYSAEILVLPLKNKHKTQPYLKSSFHVKYPTFSPDGQWVVYVSDETGQYEVYVRSFDEPEKRKYPISTDGGIEPVWSPAGHEIFYRWEDEMFAVPVQLKPIFKAGYRKYYLKNNTDIIFLATNEVMMFIQTESILS